MRVSVLQENFHKGLSIVSRAIQEPASLPSCERDSDHRRPRLRLSATNLELGIKRVDWRQGRIGGSITVPARTLQDFISTLPPERVDLDWTCAR